MGKGHTNCPKIKVHKDQMKESISEKYLGDVVDSSGSIQATIDSRISKGQGIISEILSIINEIPLGRHKIDVAMKLREVMLLNGILYNSEAWHGVTKSHIKSIEAIDEALIRGILKAHAKTPIEFLYLEVGATPIQWVIAQRRLNYLKHILSKEDHELVKKVYLAQKENPTFGDFVNLAQQNMKDLGITYEYIVSSDKKDLKSVLKKNATNAAFTSLKTELLKHKKVKHIQYDSFDIQPYLRSENLHTEEKQTITALRSQCVRNIRNNFSKMFKGRLNCPLKCDKENPQTDSQEHLLHCKKINTINQTKLTAADVFNGVEKQELIGKLIFKILRLRTRLLDELETSLSGENLDKRNPSEATHSHNH